MMQLFILFMLAGPTTAQAASALVCARYALEFLDADSAVGDDYLTSNDPLPARGAYIWVWAGGPGGGAVAALNADSSGANVGCITVPIDPRLFIS